MTPATIRVTALAAAESTVLVTGAGVPLVTRDLGALTVTRVSDEDFEMLRIGLETAQA